MFDMQGERFLECYAPWQVMTMPEYTGNLFWEVDPGTDHYLITNEEGGRYCVSGGFYWFLLEHELICLSPGGVNPSTYEETFATHP